MRQHLLPITFFCIVLLFGSCRKDPAEQPPPASGNGPSPLTLQFPGWVVDSGFLPHIPPGDPLTTQGVGLGRKLFYEKALSDDYSISCGSCHLQEHSFSDPEQFSIGTDGSLGLRNSMAVTNLAWDHGFFWDTRSFSLEHQALHPVIDQREMRNTWPVVVDRLQSHPDYPALFEQAFGTSTIDSTLVARAIAQFERTLISFGSRFDRFHYEGDSLALTEAEQRGKELFFRGAHCVDCHKAPFFTDHSVRNNGLDLVHNDPGLGGVTGSNSHMGRFKTPTLRNIAVTAPYMHDGRFTTLEEVVDFYAEGVQLDSPNLDSHMFPWMAGQIDLSQQDRADLVAFLHALTDQQFLTDPRFSDPH